jgi:putative spermidine/putrescine transport system substrate-binding protein
MLILAIAGCGSSGDTSSSGASPAAEKVTISFVSWGGVYQDAEQKAWIDSFMVANPNITVVQDGPTDYAKIKAMVEAGNVTWDVVDVQKDFGVGDSEKFCEKLDPAAIPMSELQPDLLTTTGFRAPVMIASDVIAYRTDKFGGNKPTSFADYFDLKKFPGKRGAYNWASGSLLEEALLADGVQPADLYPLDTDRAFRKLDTIKSSLVWWDTGAQSAQLLVDGEVAMGMSWNGRITDAQKTGAPIEIMWQQHFVEPDSLIIPKGSKHVAEATKLIAWITAAQNNAELSKYIAYAPSNVNAIAAVSPEVAPSLSTAHLDSALKFDDVWWGANWDKVNAEWQAWVQK